MFIGGEQTGWRSAVIYTFVEQVRRHGKDLFAYFEWVFEKLMHNPGPEELEALLPAHWIKTQQGASQTIEVEVAHRCQRCQTSDKNARGALLSAYCHRSLQNAPPVVTSKCTTSDGCFLMD